LTWQADTFAYAENHDESGGRYRGLRAGQTVTLSAEDGGVLVKADVARRQLDAETPQPSATSGGPAPGEPPTAGSEGLEAPAPGVPQIARRFHGTVRLDPVRVGLDAGRIAEEVIAHLAGQPGAEVVVTLEIEARLPNGASEQTVRAVTENGRTLRFTTHGFEQE
jgi:hypothetical protein